MLTQFALHVRGRNMQPRNFHRFQDGIAPCDMNMNINLME